MKIQKNELETPGIADDRIMRLRRISTFWKLACLKASLKKSWSCLALAQNLIKGKMLCKGGNKNSRINTVIPTKKSFFGSLHLHRFNHSFYYNKKMPSLI